MIEAYILLRNTYTAAQQKSQRSFNLLSMARLLSLLTALFAAYKYFDTKTSAWLTIGLVFLTAFLVLVRIHQRISFRLQLAKKLREINDREIDFVEKHTLYYTGGAAFVDHQHAYSFDLDIFGDKSLFQHLNRTGTSMGLQSLAKGFTNHLSTDDIPAHQQAVKELSNDVEWRQQVLALALLSKDKQAYKNLADWTERKPATINTLVNAASYLIPACIIICFVGYAFFDLPALRYIQYGFLLNLLIASPVLKHIIKENNHFDRVEMVLQRYVLLLQKIEARPFESSYLCDLQAKLRVNGRCASVQLKNIGKLFGQMNTIANVLALIVLNGFFQYHVHVYRAVLKWKKLNAGFLLQWLDVIGETEKLNSLANFAFNNKAYVFPAINENGLIAFEALGHPLIREDKRVCNDISFEKHNFLVLTGSNMSGKSTFLRSLGVNMVLASMGSVVCAKAAQVHPLRVFVSMRLSDSLSEGASYFFAEVSRLKYIMDHTTKERCFILLDEILRGTNSDDKRSGTIGVIKKLLHNGATGAIATHDIEVCRLKEDFPESIMNKRFEVNIVHDELHFDYKLLDGVCRNKSATFLMKKMHIIEQ